MALSHVQFKTLFLGAFGVPLHEAQLELDTSSSPPVARKGDKVVSLFIVDDRAIEWQINGVALTPFRSNGRDERSQAHKAEALDLLTTALK